MTTTPTVEWMRGPRWSSAHLIRNASVWYHNGEQYGRTRCGRTVKLTGKIEHDVQSDCCRACARFTEATS